ncbi:MAG: hypothetical protein ABJK59_05625 [Erythrobacter sp.]|uniref:hypothetical protein n=1 Tax=Erythrobacter sp. TaxID=1042 RepID=UPI003297E43F
MRATRPAIGGLLISGLFLSACGSGGADGPGSVSVDEAQALDEAAEMLDERRLPEGTLPPVEAPLNTQSDETQEEVSE